MNTDGTIGVYLLVQKWCPLEKLSGIIYMQQTDSNSGARPEIYPTRISIAYVFLSWVADSRTLDALSVKI